MHSPCHESSVSSSSLSQQLQEIFPPHRQVEICLLLMPCKIFTSLHMHSSNHQIRSFLDIFLTYPLPPNILCAESTCPHQESPMVVKCLDSQSLSSSCSPSHVRILAEVFVLPAVMSASCLAAVMPASIPCRLCLAILPACHLDILDSAI